ncbi:MAG TPA: hypothetical protein VFQ30_02160 [Ktedonobacteraceae bacterium]|nr:hypothetical protein [Ktedonobacteraceae bacterium]
MLITFWKRGSFAALGSFNVMDGPAGEEASKDGGNLTRVGATAAPEARAGPEPFRAAWDDRTGGPGLLRTA